MPETSLKPESGSFQQYYKNCTLCPRNCGIDRSVRQGLCGCGSTLKAARAGLHYYEEPFLSGTNGSGTVFFSGCSLGCIYCQNSPISRDGFGLEISEVRLAQIFLEQQQRGAHNINLVTGTHFTPSIAKALRDARARGLTLPVVWNSSGYEKPETLQMLQGLVDIFLPDFKTMSSRLGQRYMKAPDYPEWAGKSLEAMVNMTGEAQFIPFGQDAADRNAADTEGAGYEGEGVLMSSGVVVRHLVIPGQLEDSKSVLRYLYETYGDRIWISLMSQYTPVGVFAEEELPAQVVVQGRDHKAVREEMRRNYPELCRPVSYKEYDEAVDYAISLGIENCMIQEDETASDSFIPAFDGAGILPNIAEPATN